MLPGPRCTPAHSSLLSGCRAPRLLPWKEASTYLTGADLQRVQHKLVDLRLWLEHSDLTRLYQEVKVRVQLTHHLGQAASLGTVIQPVVGEDAGDKS